MSHPRPDYPFERAAGSELEFRQRLWFGLVVPLVVYWLLLYLTTRNSDPTAYPLEFAAAFFVPVMNVWVLFPQLRSRVAALIAGFVVPAIALVVVLI